jgi:hypothetical protein
METLYSSRTEPVCTAERPRDLEFDADGYLVGSRPIEEWFDLLGDKLIEHFGEDFRKDLNKDRAVRGMKPL